MFLAKSINISSNMVDMSELYEMLEIEQKNESKYCLLLRLLRLSIKLLLKINVTKARYETFSFFCKTFNWMVPVFVFPCFVFMKIKKNFLSFSSRRSISRTTRLFIWWTRSIWSTATTTWTISTSSRSISSSESNNVSIWWCWRRYVRKQRNNLSSQNFHAFFY